MRTGGFAAYAATISTVVLFALSGSSQALASSGGNGAGTIAADLAEATVICEPNGTGTVTTDPVTGLTTISCVIDQSVATQPGQDNQARCIEESAAPATIEECTITQTTVTGDNRAVVQQEISQKDTPTQTGMQRATITQTNISGLNDAKAEQDLKQSTNAASSQQQTGDQGRRDADPGVTILQTNATGPNTLKLDQSLQQKQKTHDDSALQNQHGRQSAHLDQPVPTAGDSRASIKQDIDQKQDGPTPGNQTQIADPHCCNFFAGSKVHVDLGQDVTQKAMMGARQFADNDADCHVTPPTAGTCNVVETIHQNGGTIRTTCNDADCTIAQQCINGACPPCPSEGKIIVCPPPPCFVDPTRCDRPTLGLSGVSANRLTALAIRAIRSERAVPLLAA